MFSVSMQYVDEHGSQNHEDRVNEPDDENMGEAIASTLTAVAGTEDAALIAAQAMDELST